MRAQIRRSPSRRNIRDGPRLSLDTGTGQKVDTSTQAGKRSRGQQPFQSGAPPVTHVFDAQLAEPAFLHRHAHSFVPGQQNRSKGTECRLMPDKENAFRSPGTSLEKRTEAFRFPAGLQAGRRLRSGAPEFRRNDLRGLPCAKKRAAQDQIRPDTQRTQPACDAAHSPDPVFRQSTAPIATERGRTALHGNRMTKKIQFHQPQKLSSRFAEWRNRFIFVARADARY